MQPASPFERLLLSRLCCVCFDMAKNGTSASFMAEFLEDFDPVLDLQLLQEIWGSDNSNILPAPHQASTCISHQFCKGDEPL